MRSFSRRRSKRYRAPEEIRAEPGVVSNEAVETLVKETVSASEVRGIPENSRLRIKRGLEKLKSEAIRKPSAKSPSRRSGKGVMFGTILIALAIFLLPPWVPIAAIVLALIGLIGFLSIVGTERISAWIVARYFRLKREDPEQAERLRYKAARASAALTRLAGRLPEKWVQGLYLPDFEPAADMPEKMRTDPFERLSV